MKNWLKYLLFGMIAIAVVACGNSNDPDTDEDELVGTWICKNFDEGVSFTMCFKSNGSGWMEWSDEDEHYTFEYSINKGKIYFEDEEHYTWVCEYTIKGNKLTIIGNPWGEDDDIDHIILTRK